MRKFGVLVPVLVIAAVAAAAALVVTRPWEEGGREDDLPTGVREELASRVVDLLETEPEGRKLVTTGTEPVACAAHALGTDPEGATDTELVKTVYAWAVCWTIVDGRPLTGVSAPIAVHFGPPVTMEKPKDGAAYSSSVRAMYPERLHDVAFDNNRWSAALSGPAQARAKELAAR